MPAKARPPQGRVSACSTTSARKHWGDRRVPTPCLPGSQPGALPLSYGQHENPWMVQTGASVTTAMPHPVHGPSPWRPAFLGGRVLHAGVLVLMAPRGDGHRAPAGFPPAPARGGHAMARAGAGVRRQAVLVHRGPDFAAPLRQSDLLESFRAAACPPGCVGSREGLATLARGQRKTPGKPFGLPGVP